MSRPTPALLACALVLAACPEERKKEDGPALRPNVRLLHQGEWSQKGCLFFDPVTCTALQKFEVLDVEVRGDGQVFALLNGNGGEGGLYLSTSRDGGNSWSTMPVISNRTDWRGAANLLVFLPRVFVALLMSEEGALAQMWPHWRVWEVNPETGADTYLGRSIDLPFGPHFEGHDGSVSGMWGDGYAGTNVLRWKTTNVLTGQVTEDGFICEEQRCVPYGDGFPIGERFYAYSYVRSAGQPNEVCRIAVNPVEDFVGYNCTSAPLVQADFPPNPAVLENQLWMRVEKDGHVLLAQPDSYAPDRLKVIDLGEGRLGRQSWKDLVAVEGNPGAPPSLLRLKNNRPVPVTLPATPCVSDAECLKGGVFGPAGGIKYVLPVEGNRYWVFYFHKEIRDTNESGSEIGSFREAIYASLEEDRNAGSSVTSPTALEKMCARVHACFPSEPNAALQACVARWSELNAANTDADRRYEAFLSTPSGCESFRETDPLAAFENSFPCQQGCYGDTAWYCAAGTGGVGSSCSYFGTGCVVGGDGNPTCEKPAGCTGTERKCEGNKAVTCPDMVTDCTALGMVCRVMTDGNPLCLPDLPTCSGSRFCDGTIARSCWSGGIAGWDGVDCARAGLECLDGNCVAALSDKLCAATNSLGTCEGTKLRYCLAAWTATSAVARERLLDCAELGLKCVAGDGGGARCGAP